MKSSVIGFSVCMALLPSTSFGYTSDVQVGMLDGDEIKFTNVLLRGGVTSEVRLVSTQHTSNIACRLYDWDWNVLADSSESEGCSINVTPEHNSQFRLMIMNWGERRTYYSVYVK
jgi:hypothetical protein